MRGKPRCTLLMHPADAAARGLGDHDTATVTSQVGSVQVRVTLTEDMMPGVVSLPHGYGHTRQGTRLAVDADHAGVSINDLTDDQAVDELIGTAAFSGTPVTVSRSGS
jgi:anaerobic selenocysteine-containing dehydrogenase